MNSPEGEINRAFTSTEVADKKDLVKKKEPKVSPPAVEIKNASLTYGKGEKAICALNHVSITVQAGTIYALLGPSGCGKTTLLSAVVGILSIQEGEIKAFGEIPKTSKCGVPGPWVGYMPQELSLYMELNAEETIRYFAKLQQMSDLVLEKRIPFLLKLMELDTASKQLVKNLSGGQQRRLSLAAAMVHYPALLILDEPTVGVDPLLRTTIWNHLAKASKQQGMSVLITTHYVEEARKADTVGLMRDGRLLREGEPETLMQEMNSPTLEGVFFELCVKDDNTLKADLDSVLTVNYRNLGFEGSLDDISEPLPSSSQVNTQKKPPKKRRVMHLRKFDRNWFYSLSMVLSFTAKNLAIFRRNFVFLMAAFFIPFGNIFLVQFIYGHTPYGLRIAVANTDQPPVFSNLFLERVDKRTLSYEVYADKESAIQSVRDGKTYAALYFPPKYTTNMVHRNRLGFDADNASLWGSVSHLYSDTSSIEISRTIFISLLDSMADLVKDHVSNLGDNPYAVDSPMVFKDPIYGTMRTEFTEFTLLNFLPDTMFLMAMALSSLTIIAERNHGLFTRSKVSGLTAAQALVSHACIQNVLFFLQACGLIILLQAFRIHSEGNLGLVGFLCFLQGNVGMAIGFLISALTNHGHFALTIAASCHLINILSSGLVWPIESFPHWFRPITYIGPETFTIIGVREIVNRGLSWTNRWVWTAIGGCFAWILIPFLLALLLFRRST